MSWRYAYEQYSEYADLNCDVCPAMYLARGVRDETTRAARANGWHLYDGPSFAGTTMSEHLCPDCAGNKKRLPVVEVLENQDPLF